MCDIYDSESLSHIAIRTPYAPSCSEDLLIREGMNAADALLFRANIWRRVLEILAEWDGVWESGLRVLIYVRGG